MLPNALLPLSLILILAARLPGFEQFRQVDRMRRMTGQLQTAELLEVTQISAQLILDTVAKYPADWEAQWGAAELLVEWPTKQRFYQAALAASGTNDSVALRFACAAAHHRQDQLAFHWLRRAEKNDQDNLVPWLVEVWLRHQAGNDADAPVEAILPDKPPAWATVFRDHGPSAAQARIRLLELAGYSPYAARRLGFMPELYPAMMARELVTKRLADSARPLLIGVAKAMQLAPAFLVTELVGESLEQTAMSTESGPVRPETRFRTVELDRRRAEIKELIATVEHNAVEFATEEEMVRYFDELLVYGEQEAMLRLLHAVGKTPAPAPK